MLESIENKYKKRVVSFVRREGRITQKQKRAMEYLWPKYGIEGSNQLLNFETIFANKNPIILEIGFGDGDSLIQMAQAYPEFNYVGIEVYRPGIGAVLSKIEENSLKNIRIFHHDAADIIKNNIPDQSLSKIFILFSDPWQKKRHHKRRLIQSGFLELLNSKLKNKGILYLATDCRDYAEQMMQLLTQMPNYQNVFGELQYAHHHHFRFKTKYELRAYQLGYIIFDLVFEKKCKRSGR